MTTAVIGAIRVNLSADTAEFKRGLTDAEKTVDKFSRAINSTLKSSFLAFGAGVAAAAGSMVMLTKFSLETISAQVDLAKRVGASVSAIQTLQHAAELSGASQEALAKTLGALNDKLGEAAREGAGPAYEALQRLGLSARELSQMDADERIKVLSDRMAELGYSTQQTGETLKSLGVRQQEIKNLFIEGSGAINEARDELKAWGVLLSDVDAAKVEAAGDAWDKLWKILEGVGNQLVVRLAPVMQAVAGYLGDAAKEAGGFGEAIDKAISMGIRLFVGINKEIYDFQKTLYGVSAAFIDMFNTAAGAPPNLLAKIFGGTAEDYGFKPIENRYHQLLEQLGEPPSMEKWEAWWTEIQKKAELATLISLKPARPNIDGRGSGSGPTKEEEDELVRFQEQQAVRLTALQESLMTEREAELAAYEQRKLDLEDFYAQKQIMEDEYRMLLVKNQQALSTKLKALDEDVARSTERNAERQRRAYFQIADDIGSVLDSVFGENKMVAMGMAVINTAQSITKTLAEYGATPHGLAAAAVAAAAGAAEIATIAATTKSGGGGGRGSRSSATAPPAAAAPSAPAAQAGSSQTLYVSGLQPGQLLTSEYVREFAEKLLDFQRDGGKVVLAPF
jgi:hypothetical protein